VKQLGPTDLKRLHRSWQRRTDRRVALLLDGIQSPFNMGSIVRTAAALRVDHLYLAGATISPNHHKAGRTAMGTERYLTWTQFPDGAEAVAAAADDGYVVVGLELAEGAVPLHQLELAEGAEVCLAVGNEDHGLSAACLAACSAVAYLPQLGRVGSLNVATAAAVALYEVRRREWSATGPPRPEEGDQAD
jgi:tRNA (guanosine-2'-O-)-methyltransferase